MIIIWDYEERDREDIIQNIKDKKEQLKKENILRQERHERIRVQHYIEKQLTIVHAMLETIKENGWDNISSDNKSFIKNEAADCIDELEKMHRTIRAMRDHPKIEDHLLRGD